MHEGRMIFTGSMQDMKKRLRRDGFSLELEGDADNIRLLANEVNNLEGIIRVPSFEVLSVESMGFVLLQQLEISVLCRILAGMDCLEREIARVDKFKDIGHE